MFDRYSLSDSLSEAEVYRTLQVDFSFFLVTEPLQMGRFHLAGLPPSSHKPSNPTAAGAVSGDVLLLAVADSCPLLLTQHLLPFACRGSAACAAPAAGPHSVHATACATAVIITSDAAHDLALYSKSAKKHFTCCCAAAGRAA
jgi:hypothetical protein